MTPEQRENLLKLATYLESLPENYNHFDMSWFLDHRKKGGDVKNLVKMMVSNPSEFVKSCGTVACALGHGPLAGIPFQDDEVVINHNGDAYIHWDLYSTRAFGTDYHPLFDFLFGARWTAIDNTPRGAAARIRYYLKTGESLPVGESSVPIYMEYEHDQSAARTH